MKKIIFYFCLFLVAFVSIIFFLPTLIESGCISLRKFKRLDLNGVVTKKYNDYSEHSFPYIEINQFSNDSIIKIGLVGDRSNLFSQIQIGDTVVKSLNTHIVNLKRINSEMEFNIDFGCVTK